jgi:hypothetical protein
MGFAGAEVGECDERVGVFVPVSMRGYEGEERCERRGREKAKEGRVTTRKRNIRILSL